MVLRTAPHSQWERRGDGLLTNVTISLLEALVGFEREVRGQGLMRIRGLAGKRVPGLRSLPLQPQETRALSWANQFAGWARTAVAAPASLGTLRALCLPLHPPYLQIEHLDGHKVQIGTSGVTRPGEVRWFQGEGMPQLEKVGGGCRAFPEKVVGCCAFPVCCMPMDARPGQFQGLTKLPMSCATQRGLKQGEGALQVRATGAHITRRHRPCCRHPCPPSALLPRRPRAATCG